MLRNAWLLLASSLLMQASIAAAEPGHPWASFPIGSWVEMRTQRNGASEATDTKWTLRRLGPAEAVVKMEIRTADDVTSRDVSFSIPSGPVQADESRAEAFAFKDKKLSCTRYEYSSQRTSIIKCAEVPGHVVRLETATTTTTLVDYGIPR